jgi:hypothetical protein
VPDNAANIEQNTPYMLNSPPGRWAVLDAKLALEQKGTRKCQKEPPQNMAYMDGTPQTQTKLALSPSRQSSLAPNIIHNFETLLQMSQLLAHLFCFAFCFSTQLVPRRVALRSTLFLLNPIFLQVS